MNKGEVKPGDVVRILSRDEIANRVSKDCSGEVDSYGDVYISSSEVWFIKSMDYLSGQEAIVQNVEDDGFGTECIYLEDDELQRGYTITPEMVDFVRHERLVEVSDDELFSILEG